jgi:hypothetical protein
MPFIFIASVSLLLFQGCARPVLQTIPASEDEAMDVISAFLQVYQGKCSCCIDADADATVSVSGWLHNHNGKLTGLLQAMAPGYLKFIAVNPLGQPIYILVTNGSEFTSLNILERKAYSGPVNSETFKKFSPQGFRPEFSFYWLTGRLAPGGIQVETVRRDRGGQAYWLQIHHKMTGNESLVLFNPVNSRILRHIILDEKKEHLVDVTYDAYQPETGNQKMSVGENVTAANVAADAALCSIPGNILVSASSGKQNIEIQLSSLLGGAAFAPEDFDVKVPPDFENIVVK